MAHRQPRTLVMVAHIRHGSDRRLRRAYRLLWRWVTANEEFEGKTSYILSSPTFDTRGG